MTDNPETPVQDQAAREAADRVADYGAWLVVRY